MQEPKTLKSSATEWKIALAVAFDFHNEQTKTVPQKKSTNSLF
jgi:hypothetical protein